MTELSRLVTELEAELDHVRFSLFPEWHAVDNLVGDLKNYTENTAKCHNTYHGKDGYDCCNW